MEKQKSLDLKLILKSTFKQSPIQISFEGLTYTLPLGTTEIPIVITSIDEIKKLSFTGFIPDDKTQLVELSLKYNNIDLDLGVLTIFTMIDNKYVENKTIKNYTTIYFNGELTIQFFKNWFSCNLLNGGALGYTKKHIGSVLKNYHDNYDTMTDLLTNKIHLETDILCLGTCHFTTQHGPLANTIPAMLSKKTNKKVINVSIDYVNGITFMDNVEIITEKINCKDTIILAPVYDPCFTIRAQFLDAFFSYPLILGIDYSKKLNFFNLSKNKALTITKKRKHWINNMLKKRISNFKQKILEKGCKLIVLKPRSAKSWYDHLVDCEIGEYKFRSDSEYNALNYDEKMVMRSKSAIAHITKMIEL